MAFRKLKQKKYSGIIEYFNPKSDNKETRALYISYRDISGNAVKKKLDTLNLSEAAKILSNIKYEIEREKKFLNTKEIEMARQSIKNKITLDQIAEWYFNQRSAKDNIKDYQAYKNRVAPLLGSKVAAKLTTDDIQYLQKELIKKYAPKTTNETINSLRALYNRAIKKKKLTCSNPVVLGSGDIQKIEQNTEPGRVLTDSELNLLFNTFKNGNYEIDIVPRPTLYLFAKILYFTGARPSGVIDIQVKHCNFDENKISIKAMKKGKNYQAQVKQELMDLIKDWILKHDLSFNDYIFYPQQTFVRTGKGKDKPTAYSGFRKQGQKVFNKLFNVGIPNTEVMHRVSFYSLRRTAGTKVYKAKGIMHAMLFLNHTSVKTTQIYLNVKGDMEGIADIL